MTETHNVTQQNRIYFLDNLRTFMIFLVVLLHVGGVYESSGFWALFWIVDDPATNELVGLINMILDIFVMPTIFFISGFFVPFSLAHNKAWSFLKSKFRRLMVPWGVAVVTLIPAYKFIFLYSRGLPQEDWTTYFHWNSGMISNQNWLWYLPVLFMFNALYFAFSKMNISLSKISMKAAVAVTFIVGLAFSYVMDVFKLQGWTNSFFLHFQNERLLVYFMIFLLGAICNNQKIFDSKPSSKKFYFLMNGIAWVPISLYSIFVINSFTKPGQFITSEISDKLILWSSYNLSLLSLGYLMVATFRFYLNKPIKIWDTLNSYSYGVYIIHTIVLGLFATALLNTIIPSIPKYLLVTVVTFAASNLFVHFYKTLKTKLIKQRKEITMRKIATAMIIVSLIAGVGCQKQGGPVEKQPPHVNIHIAALQGNLTAIQQHINAGSDLNIKDDYGSNPLLIATTFGKTDVAKALINAGADLNVTDAQGSTPLHSAAFFCRTEIVEALLAKGADKTVRNDMGATALDSVMPPFEDVKGIYDSIGNALKPLGLRLDYDRIEKTRPVIAEMLR